MKIDTTSERNRICLEDGEINIYELEDFDGFYRIEVDNRFCRLIRRKTLGTIVLIISKRPIKPSPKPFGITDKQWTEIKNRQKETTEILWDDPLNHKE